jgi:hypothetical protein
VFFAVSGVFALLAAANAINGWPTVVASFSTAQPYSLQVLTRIGVGVVGLIMPAAVLGLAAGTLPLEVPIRRLVPRHTSALLGAALGLIVVAAGAAARRGGEPPWPDVAAYGSYVPLVAAATGTLPAFLLQSITLMAMLSTVDDLTGGWTRRRVLAGIGLAAAGAVLGAPGGDGIATWALSAAVSGAGLVCAYVFLLRHDLTLAPFVIATLAAASLVHDAFASGAVDLVAGYVLGILLVALAAWWLCGLLRRARDASATPAIAA